MSLLMFSCSMCVIHIYVTYVYTCIRIQMNAIACMYMYRMSKSCVLMLCEKVGEVWQKINQFPCCQVSEGQGLAEL